MKKIRKGDNVRVLRGKNAGKEGEVLAVVSKKDRKLVVVKGLNIVKKSQKPNPQLGITGGIVEFERPIDISNVMLLDGKKVTKVRIEKDAKTGKKSRVSKKSNKSI